MITVMGATGNTGRKITELLLEGGEEVRALGRSPEKLAELDALGAETVAGDVRDADYLLGTFAGADAVYTLTALDPTLPDYHADQDRRGEAIASAIRESGVPHVVALSAIGAELASGNGFIASLHRQERRLRALDRVNLMILRPGAFFEGFYAALETIRHERVVADSVAPEAKVPMIATADIAAVAAGALRERNWSGTVVRELLGPRDLTYAEATAAIGAAIGEPDLAVRPAARRRAGGDPHRGRRVLARLRRPVRRVQPGAERRQAALARGSQREQHDPDRVRGVRR